MSDTPVTDLATYEPEPGHGLPVFEPQSTSEADRWEEHVSYWRAYWTNMQDRLWLLASIAASVEANYGESNVKRFAYEVQCSSTWVYRLARLHRTWRNLRPSQVLSVSHHLEAMEAPDPQAAIERAELENLSTRQLRAEIKGEVYTPHESDEHGTDPGGELSTRLQHWYGFIKARPCLRCGTTEQIEAAHVRGFVNVQTGALLRRSHKGLAAWCCLPICSSCHRTAPDSLHNVGEEAFIAELGAARTFQTLATLLAMFFVRDEG